jgi:hypothetical protein
MRDTEGIPVRPVKLRAEDVHNLLALIDALNDAAEGDSNDAEIDAGHDLASDLLGMLRPATGDTPVREDDLSQVLGDAYAYRLGEAYGPDDEDLDDDDRDGLARVQRLAAAFGVDIPA